MGAAGIVFFLTEANRGIGIAFVVIGVVFVGANSNNWYQSEVEDLKPRLPRGGDPY